MIVNLVDLLAYLVIVDEKRAACTRKGDDLQRVQYGRIHRLDAYFETASMSE